MAERTVLVLGAGRSSGYLIEYLAQQAVALNIKIVVADQNLDWAMSKIGSLPHCTATKVETASDYDGIEKLVASATLVISLLPVHMHMTVANLCLKYLIPMFTASYQTVEMESLKDEIAGKGLLFLNECGCDPGLDHLTAVQVLDALKQKGHRILSYEGYTGGLVAPDSDNNPWHYKFSWNPRNVILAGQGGPAQFLRNNKAGQLGYPDLFHQVVEVDLADFPDLVGYFNRNSMPYAELYGIPMAQTVIRGTLRHRHFCTAWYPLAFWGLNSPKVLDRIRIENLPTPDLLTHKLTSELGYLESDCRIVLELWDYLGIWELIETLRDQGPNPAGVFETKSLSEGPIPAEWLETRMTERMSLSPSDRDMVLMTHLIRTLNPDGQGECHRCTLMLEGEGGEKSAMAKTVGLPLAMAVELYLQGKITETGLQRPLGKAWYGSILPALENHGIKMQHLFERA